MWLVEARTVFARARVRALLGVLAAVPVFLALVIYLKGGPAQGHGPAFLDRATENAAFMALAVLVVTEPFFVPLAISVVVGDALAGEASLGTLRYLLTRPCGRGRLVLAKGLVVALFCLAATGAVAVAGLLAGLCFFPHGVFVTLSGSTVSFGDGAARSLLAAVVVAGSMLGLAAIGLFVSSLTDVPIAAMAITLGCVVVSAVLDSVSQVAFLHPWLFTNYWDAFEALAASPVRWGQMGKDLLLQAGYVAVFGSAAWARMTTRDVLA